MGDRGHSHYVSYEDFRRLQEEIKCLQENVKRLEIKIDQNNDVLQEMASAWKTGKNLYSFSKVITVLGGAILAIFAVIKQFPHWKQ
ncbi:hypothetical protein B488_05200 [Liberibacter crescens BT-1]|uniref:Uncharacterized protein n=1 Tax=Liberibacter crescens (strain BT-1) TaxID=1215343 RepID=L0EU98_LIBCB|nr:hypothetical protein [Liberibacter crescens]AGA64512.1 hypothetical protein B488_05200 [Liberibacter crescens BT-1]AMC12667.1 hypothetical protein RL73_02695 [Liberibacter crescens]